MGSQSLDLDALANQAVSLWLDGDDEEHGYVALAPEDRDALIAELREARAQALFDYEKRLAAEARAEAAEKLVAVERNANAMLGELNQWKRIAQSSPDDLARLKRIEAAAQATVTLAEQNDYSADEAEEIQLCALRAALTPAEEE